MKPSDLRIGMILDIPELYKMKVYWKVVTIYCPEYLESSNYPSHYGKKRSVARVIVLGPSFSTVKYINEEQLARAKQVTITRYQGYRKANGELFFTSKKSKLPKVEGAFYEDIE